MAKSEDLIAGVYRFEDFCLDASRRTLHCDGQVVELRAKGFDLLLCLVSRAGRVVTKAELFETVWPSVVVTDESLTRCVSDVRQALGDAHQRIVKTVPRRGYVLSVPVSVEAAASVPWPAAPGVPAGAESPRPQPATAPAAASDRARMRVKPWVALCAFAGSAFLVVAVANWLGLTQAPHSISSTSQQRAALPTGATRPLSIVVLPLVNASNDADQAYFADGFTEDLTTDLSRIPGSFVIARSSANAYKGKTVDVRDIGGQLSVRYVLEGSVQRLDDVVRLNLRLIDAESGGELWADRMDGSRRDMGALQSLVTGAVAHQLHVEMFAAEAKRSLKLRPVNPDARDLAWQAFSLMDHPRTRESIAAARNLLQRAVAMDPNSAFAWAGLAHSYANDLANLWVTGAVRDDWLLRSEQAANKAYAIDANNPYAVLALGRVLQLRGNPERALAMFQRVVALNRNSAPAWASIGSAYATLGEPDESIKAGQEALRLSPRDSRLPSYMAAIAGAHLYAGRDEVALAWARRAIVVNPAYSIAHAWLAAAAANLGDLETAHDALSEFKRLQPGYTLGSFRAERHGDNTNFLRQRERLYHGLKKAGLDE